jgi:phosphinothricin acetyltransferase
MVGQITARLATESDAGRIADIYNQGIEDRVATFETELRTASTVRSWFSAPWPIVVVECDGEVIAWANASQYRPRACYAGICEFSVYVDRASRGAGAGKVAMQALIRQAAAAGYTKLLSRVFLENTTSRRLLQSLGFREVGVYHRHGQLDGEWRDVVIVERLLAPERDGESALRSGQEVIVVKTHWNDSGSSWKYPARVILCDREGWTAVEANWSRPNADVEGVRFVNGGRIVEYFSTSHRFNVFQVFGPSGEFTGIYANVTAPLELSVDEGGQPVLIWEDHWIDVIRLPDGTVKVLDEDEFAASGIQQSNPVLAAKILAAKDELLAQIEAGIWDARTSQ